MCTTHQMLIWFSDFTTINKTVVCGGEPLCEIAALGGWESHIIQTLYRWANGIGTGRDYKHNGLALETITDIKYVLHP